MISIIEVLIQPEHNSFLSMKNRFCNWIFCSQKVIYKHSQQVGLPNSRVLKLSSVFFAITCCSSSIHFKVKMIGED
ncbi:hypothetical protein SOVF_104680 [Spinacia oleracea]|nr:hypothetical protein SOVF_104680 [Spinacia oleracea]